MHLNIKSICQKGISQGLYFLSFQKYDSVKDLQIVSEAVLFLSQNMLFYFLSLVDEIFLSENLIFVFSNSGNLASFIWLVGFCLRE